MKLIMENKKIKLLDKEKLILLFNINVEGMSEESIDICLKQTIEHFKNFFDDSVKCIFAAVKGEEKPAVQNITDFPTDGMELIKDLVKYYENNDEELLKIQINAVKEYLKTYYAE